MLRRVQQSRTPTGAAIARSDAGTTKHINLYSVDLSEVKLVAQASCLWRARCPYHIYISFKNAIFVYAPHENLGKSAIVHPQEFIITPSDIIQQGTGNREQATVMKVCLWRFFH